jgi:hypothetical protein
MRFLIYKLQPVILRELPFQEVLLQLGYTSTPQDKTGMP